MLFLIATLVKANFLDAVLNNSSKSIVVEETVSLVSQADFVKEYIRILSSLEERPLLFPKVVLAQSILETGHFKSKVFWQNNNLVGMKPNNRGYCLPKEYCGDKVHACYLSLKESLLDYRDWQYEKLDLYRSHYELEVTDDEEYLLFLDEYVVKGESNQVYIARYAEDPLYTTKLRNLVMDTLLIPNDFGALPRLN